MSYFFPSITPKWYAPNLTYIMKKHEKHAQKSAEGGGPMSELGTQPKKGLNTKKVTNMNNVFKYY